MAPESLPAEPRKPKNIMIFCDGTGNKFIDDPNADGSNSNVVKLYSTLKIDNDQIGYYHPGVGTAADPTARNWVEGQWSRIKGMAFGEGFKDNVLDAYQYLMKFYDDGDQVYIFGFSRGAYTARALAGLLDGYGLMCKGNQGHLPYAWNEYVKQHDDRGKHKVESNLYFKETFSRRKFRIHFLGIWDTVSSVGWINSPVRLFNVAQNPTVRIGRHAISIDERRCYFRDNLWQVASAEQLASVASEADPNPTQDVLEVWFPGVHSDIGGSYSQETSVLSNGPLEWMIGEARKADAQVKGHMEQLVLGKPVEPMPDMPDEITRVDILKDLYRKPTITEVHKSLHGPWLLLELMPHRYYDKDDGAENWRTPLGMRRRLPSGTTRLADKKMIEQKTYVHKTAKELMERKDLHYAPPNIVGGVTSLKPADDVPGQDPGTIFLYDPPQDPKPFQNRAWYRWSVMIGLTALELAILAAAGVAVGKGIRRL